MVKGKQTAMKHKGAFRLAGKLIGWVILVPALLLLTANVTLFAQSVIRPGVVPRFFGLSPLVVHSGSMLPTLQLDDVVIVKKVRDLTDIAVGDIVTYKFPDMDIAVTHRVTVIEDHGGKRYFTMKGDYNPGEDVQPVPEDYIVGRYVGKIPRIGALVVSLRKPLVLALCVAGPLVLFLVIDMLRRHAFYKKQRMTEQDEQDELAYLRELAAGLLHQAEPPKDASQDLDDNCQSDNCESENCQPNNCQPEHCESENSPQDSDAPED